MVTISDLPTNPDDCNDPLVYDALSSGTRLGVFQLDSSLSRRTLKKVRPQKFGELSDVLALVRPGAMDHIDKYAERRGEMQPEWRFHPELDKLDDIVGPTHSVLLYQEQVLQALNVICGWDYGDADLVLGALRKKNHEKLAAAKPDYIRDGGKNGYSEEALEAFWQILLPFADYSFAKAHASAYALTSYWTGWLLVHHPNEYYAALLTANNDDMDKLGPYLDDARKNGVAVLPPDVNESDFGFTPTKKGIRFGLSAIKGVGAAVISEVKEMRVESLDAFYDNVSDKLNTRSLGALIQAGAFDEFGCRVEHAEKANEWLERAKLVKKAKANGDQPFSFGSRSAKLNKQQSNKGQMQLWELELLGTRLTTEQVTFNLNRPLTENEAEWLAKIASQYPGDERIKFSLSGASWYGLTPISPSGRLWTMIEALDAVTVTLE